MDVESKGRIAALAAIALLVMACNMVDPIIQLGDLPLPESDAPTAWKGMSELDMTRAALEYEIQQVQETQTAQAAGTDPSAAGPAGAPDVPAPQVEPLPVPQSAHPPKILAVDIARQIPADGTKVGGTIIFEDSGHDVVLLRADVIAASLRADSWTYDPRQNMVWNGDRGIAAFQVWCTGDPQDVSYSFTLADAAGSISPAWRVDYTCK